MARTVRYTEIETRAARARLKQRSKPYWRAIESGMHLGYRAGKRGGVWLARFYAEGKYRETVIGRADDVLDADGVAALSFRQAQDRARDWFAAQARVVAGMEPAAKGPYSVADAMRDYLDHYVARGGKGQSDTENKINALILPALGAIPVSSLTTKRLRDWHHALAAAPARVRSGLGEAQAYRKRDDADAKRARRASANRVWTVLRAALNHAKRDKKMPSDDAWRDVKPFKGADVPVIRYLSDAECRRLVNATDAEFQPVVRAALLTGCRLGELLALRVADFNSDAGMLAVRASKGGKPRHVVLTDEGRRFFEEMAAGRPSSDALIFLRLGGTPWHRGAQQQPMAEACEGARISPAITFHVLRHTHASLLAMKGVPMPVIGAQLGHAPGSPITARHYAHLGPSYVAEQIRAAFPVLGIGGTTNVAPLRPRRARDSA